MNDPSLTFLPDPGEISGPTGDPALGRRIEDWIVSTIDDRAPSPVEADWLASLDWPEPARRTHQAREPGPPRATGAWARFRLSRHRGVTLVTLTDQALIKEARIVELAGDLQALSDAGTTRLVLDFHAVERLSTWAADVLAAALRRFLAAEPGSVKLAGVRADLAPLLALVGLEGLVPTCPDAPSAIVGPWPDRAEFRPLPVSIIAALLTAPGPQAPARPGSDPASDLDDDEEGEPAMNPNRIRLIIQDGPMMGRAVEIKASRFVIGRCPACDLQVGSSLVSRSHAALSRRGGRLYLRDLASTNGTVLNGQPLRQGEAEVVDGDVIRIGPVDFALAIGPRPDSPSADPRSLSIGLGPETAADQADATLDLAIEPDEADTFKAEVMEGVLVLTPLEADLADEPAVGRLRDALMARFDAPLPRRVVVSLAHVGSLSSRAIGVLVAHHFRLDRVGGALRVCLANPRVAVVLDQVRLTMLVDCHQTVEDAVIAAWPRAEAGALARP